MPQCHISELPYLGSMLHLFTVLIDVCRFLPLGTAKRLDIRPAGNAILLTAHDLDGWKIEKAKQPHDKTIHVCTKKRWCERFDLERRICRGRGRLALRVVARIQEIWGGRTLFISGFFNYYMNSVSNTAPRKTARITVRFHSFLQARVHALVNKPPPCRLMVNGDGSCGN